MVVFSYTKLLFMLLSHDDSVHVQNIYNMLKKRGFREYFCNVFSSSTLL